MKVALKNLVEIKSGYSPSTFELMENGSIPYVKVEDMNNCTKYQNESREYCEDADRSVPAGAIIFPKRGAAIMNNKVRITATDICMDTNMMAIIPTGKIQSEFLYYTITHEKLSRIADTSTIPQINNKHINPYKVALPPLPEQKAIADLLSTWDEAIEKTERLIRAKEMRFKWLLWELISEPRNTQKDAKWKKVKLRDVCKVTTGQSAPQDLSVFTSFGFPFIRVSSLDFLLGKSGSEQTEYISMEKGNELKMTLFQPGTVLFAKSGMSALQPRICKLKKPSFVVSHLCALIPKKSIHEDYLMYSLMKFHPNRLIQGDGFPSIKTSEVSSLKILLPPLEEQKAIAEALTALQQEIDLLKQLAGKYKTQKRGLMQRLLTGDWRIKPDVVKTFEK